MDKTLKIYIGIVVLLLVSIVVINIYSPKPINWTPTYDTKDKNPFGLYIFDHEISGLLKDNKIQKLNETAYEYLDANYDADSLVSNYKVKGTFLSISEFPYIDKQSLHELFYFASRGNTIFLSMKTFPQELLDSLKIDYQSDFAFSNSVYNWTANPKLGIKKYNLIEGMGNNYFSKIDTLTTTILGYQGTTNNRKVNFIKVPYKAGYFYLHTQPAAFTNFHLLKGDHNEYTSQVLSYIPKKDTIFWYVKNQNGDIASSSMLRYIISQPTLKSGWFLFLSGMVIFMFFNAKRKQRIVPIIKPLANTTVDFAKTIGNLYFQEGDHDNIIQKKIIYFLERIRQDYLLDTTLLDDNFIKKLQQKSGKEIADIQKVIYLINQHRKQHYTSVESDLLEINTAIEKIIN